MKTSITGIIKHVELIEVNELNLQFIYGTVESDRLGRWQPGNWMVSSPIERIDAENLLVHTLNSLYKVDVLPSSISLTAEQFLLVRQGISPSFILR
ncbi:hypothetical protein FGD67_01600 [Colwellia sp. M166]|uniref:hypothetical protein n=1 Tax=Colwellia sp. M166 TaxID=2583805 RepID=UPI00211DA725|nr:hypothetical protein [Colwellia sp. M166]UUO22035.1 hypothetical protein FGD67_01600 [Colwellia sp. M166]